MTFLNNARYFLYNKSLKKAEYVGPKKIPLENKRKGKANQKPFSKWDVNSFINMYLSRKFMS